jgi:sugar fermentation stimulation protein A
MIYSDIVRGIFIARPNRFLAEVEVDGRQTIAHVKNTGRCKELLIPGVRVILQRSDNQARKTEYDLIAVWKGERLINMDSLAPNRVWGEYLQSGQFADIEDITFIKPEAKYGDSRFDFYVESGKRKIFIEIKGVTLEKDGVALFPDAPTQRGVKHLHELARCVGDGFEAQVVFVVQMSDVRYFTPNDQTHPAFGVALADAVAAGVKAVAMDCLVTENSLEIGKPIPMEICGY